MIPESVNRRQPLIEVSDGCAPLVCRNQLIDLVATLPGPQSLYLDAIYRESLTIAEVARRFRVPASEVVAVVAQGNSALRHMLALEIIEDPLPPAPSA